MNQSRTKPIVDAVRLELSMKMTDSPGAIVVIPLRGTESDELFELSSIVQPVISTGVDPPLVTSNQSSPKGLSPLDHGATSEIKRVTALVGNVGALVGDAVGPLVGALVGDAVGPLVGALVGDAVGPLDGGEVGAFVGDAVGTFVGDAVGAFVGDDVGALVGDDVGILEGPLVGDDVGFGVTGERVGGAVGAFVGVDVGVDVGALFGALVGDDVGPLVGDGVGALVGDDVGEVVGGAVGAFVGGVVGALVGDDVGEVVGDAVGAIVGVNVGTAVGDNVGPLVGDAVGFEVIGLVIVPGEPVSVYPGVGLADLKAPFTPTTLKVEMVTPVRPAELSNVCRFGVGVEVPNTTLVCRTPAELYRFTASPLVPRPTFDPE